MAYTKQTWVDGDTTKPLSAARMGVIETGIETVAALADTNATAVSNRVPTSRTVAGKALTADVTLVKGDVGLANVDNTADTAKPVSTAQQAALDGKVGTARTVAGKALTADVTLVKADVGLGSVDNTSDASKPVSTATQTALDAKAATTDPRFTDARTPTAHTHPASQISDSTTVGRAVVVAADAAAARTAIGAGTSNLALGTVAGTAKAGDYAPTKADVGLGNVDNTADTAKPVSTAQQTALDGKAATTHVHAAADVTSGVFAPARISATATNGELLQKASDGASIVSKAFTVAATASAIATRGTDGTLTAADGTAATHLASFGQLTAHATSTTNPHAVTASQVGLGNVTNVAQVQAVTTGAKLWIGTQAAYDAIGTKDATTLYAITA